MRRILITTELTFGALGTSLGVCFLYEALTLSPDPNNERGATLIMGAAALLLGVPLLLAGAYASRQPAAFRRAQAAVFIVPIGALLLVLAIRYF